MVELFTEEGVICRENDRPHRHVPVHRSAGSRGKIDRLVPHVRLMEQPPHESRDTASVALEFPTPLVVLNSTIRQALSFLFSACDTVQTDKTERGICFTFTVSKMWITEDSE